MKDFLLFLLAGLTFVSTATVAMDSPDEKFMRTQTESSHGMSSKKSTFDEYFSKVVRYEVRDPQKDETQSKKTHHKEIHRFFQLEDREKTREENEQLICQNLITFAPFPSHFLIKIGDSDCTYLEKLFEVNLGYMAANICSKIIETKEELPEKYNTLLQIHQGQSVENDFSSFPIDFIRLAYKVANNSQNRAMVNRLYPFADVAEKAEVLKQSHPIIYQDYIHEAYWSYNLEQLHDYGCRIIEKLRPTFIGPEDIRKENNAMIIQGLPVRRASFGYVMPNLYLRKKLGNSNLRSVAKIFLLPKGDTVAFTFKMPYVEGEDKMDTKKFKYDALDDNPLQVLSKDFAVYQEWIEGIAFPESHKFEDLGHRDYNTKAIQIIFNKEDCKHYLIDTKEKKNFFAPFVSPYMVNYKKYSALSEEYSALFQEIKSSNAFELWQADSQEVAFDAKSLHFDPRVIYVPVTVPLNK